MPTSRPPSEIENSGLGPSPGSVPASPAPPSGTAEAEGQVEDLIRLSQLSNAVLMRGDADAYAALVALSNDFTSMSPFGGTPRVGLIIPPSA